MKQMKLPSRPKARINSHTIMLLITIVLFFVLYGAGCVMYAKRTIFDLVLPYLVTEVPVTKEQLAGLGHGGLCLNCPVCHFPNCGFGRWQ